MEVILKYPSHTLGEKFRKAVNLLGKSLGKEGAYNTPKPHQGSTNMKNHLYSLYQMVLKSLTFYLRILSILFAKLLLGEKVKLIVDGTILEVANLNRARIQRIKQVFSE